MSRQPGHTVASIKRARMMWIAGQPVRAIAEALGITRNAVIGIAHRNEGFPARPSPIRRIVNAGLST